MDILKEKKPDMAEYRKQIDEVDAELLKLFEQRMDIVKNIGEYKREHGLGVFDAKREQDKLARTV